jgi:hypothetical protein
VAFSIRSLQQKTRGPKVSKKGVTPSNYLYGVFIKDESFRWISALSVVVWVLFEICVNPVGKFCNGGSGKSEFCRFGS